jgi:selenide,water dikinase
LLLCGPLGSGVLFAAAMAGAARPGWIDAALETMQRSQAPLVELLAAHGCHACTDITGFGLLGHLGEMLAAGGARAGGDVLGPARVAEDRAAAEVEDEDGNQDSRGGARGRPDARRGAPELTVQIEARRIPTFAGALELLNQGWASTLAPANGRALALLEGPVRLVGESTAALEALLIDPQTCGPLLAALPAARAGDALAALQRAGFPEAALIGRVLGAPELSQRS